MRRAIWAPVLSGLVMPGLGQIVNNQRAKGAFMVAAVSMMFMITLAMVVIKVVGAMEAVAEGPPPADKWAALQTHLLSQGLGWLWLPLGLLAAMWLYGVVDAARAGARMDRSPPPEED